ncbi:MAG TPA: fibronectin type III domain-containing protein [Flavitalea sp.]|nr:fibronectin type III domain-containing protein [Flavitalea sp.]
MKTILLFAALVVATQFASSQNVFNPSDPIVRYSSSAAYGSAQRPDTNRAGLQKWVSTPTSGISTGSQVWDASSFKAYYLYGAGIRVPYRIKFPKTYTTDPTKKFPVLIFLHGAGEVGCATNGGLYNNEKQLWLGGQLFMQEVDKGNFDGFLIYPQLVTINGCWDSWGSTATARLTNIVAMLDSLGKYARLDIDRVALNGLSGGGYGDWRFASVYPKRVTKIIPSAAAGNTSNRTAFVHIPIWFATGAKDPDPSPAQATYSYNRMKEIGADIRYTQYADLGHAVWYRHWREPDYIPYLNDMHKANPLIFFGQSDFCAGQAINAKIGITAGFYAYEWQKDLVTIATRTNGVNTIVDGTSIISYTGNEMNVKLFGSYRVRFKRSASEPWSDWSMKPAVIKAKVSSNADAITVSGLNSKVLPALNGKTTVPLTLPSGYTAYQWVRVSDDAVVGSQQTFNAPVGVFKAKYNDQFGCPYSFSPNFTVIDANGSPKPDAASNLVATGLSLTSTRLDWTQNANETNFEIYRGTTSGGPYQLINITAANAITYTDNDLDPNITYYYVVRAVNNTGAANASNQASPYNGNTAPVISTLNNMYSKTQNSTSQAFTVTDNPGDITTVSIPLQPSFITLNNLGGGNYNIIANPTLDDLGWTDIKVLATDNIGKQSWKVFSILITDKDTRSYFVNFGSNGKTAPAPWNNWLGVRAAGSVLNNLKDENNIATGISITAVNGWSGITDLGHITGNNSGYYPDSVLQSGVADNGVAKQIKFSGLNATKLYNVVLVGSQNEGLVATASYTTGTQTSTLNASYNTNKSANLNSLAPDGTGSIIVTITRTGTSAFTYLNGLTLEEYDPSITLLGPSALFVEPINRTTADIKWADKTKNEQATGGYELQRATDATFSTGLITISLPANTTSYRNTGLTANTKYFYRVRAVNGGQNSAYSNVEATITPSQIVYVNFNTTVTNEGAPWNNTAVSSLATFTKSNMKNQSNTSTTIDLTLTRFFNGEFNAGRRTGNNSGVVPDNVLQSDYWLDNTQLSQFRLDGLNTSRRYRIGFFGSSSAAGWFKGNYTATYTVKGRTVYLNSWENTTKIVYIGDIVPDAGGTLLLDFSTTANAAYGFNGGIVIMEYTDGSGGTIQNSTLDDQAPTIVEPVVPNYNVKAYPNPFNDIVNLDFNNDAAGNRISTEVYDLAGRLVYRKDFNSLPAGRNVLVLNGIEQTKNTSVCLVALKVNGKVAQTIKLLRNKLK